MNLTVGIEEDNQHYTMKLIGEIDVYTAPELKEKLLPLTEESNNTIQIDLENTNYLDSTGLGVFISAFKSAKEHQSYLELINVRGRVLRLFKVTGLDEIIHIKTEPQDEGVN